MKKSIFRHYALAIAVAILPMPAYAYLDPGTGSILLQGLLAGVAGAAMVLKLYWQRIIEFFKSLTGGPTKLNNDESDN